MKGKIIGKIKKKEKNIIFIFVYFNKKSYIDIDYLFIQEHCMKMNYLL